MSDSVLCLPSCINSKEEIKVARTVQPTKESYVHRTKITPRLTVTLATKEETSRGVVMRVF